MNEILVPKQIDAEIRLHHLVVWRDIVPAYLKFTKGVKPWDVPFEEITHSLDFSSNHAKKDIDLTIQLRDIFRRNVELGADDVEDYLYLCDVVGKCDEKYDEMLIGRKKYFNDIFKLCLRDKSSKIILTAHSDNFCNSCAIGEHCRESILDENNNDFHYAKALDEVLKTREGWGYFRKKMIGATENGKLYMTTELLFNMQFHNLLMNGVIKQWETLIK